MPLTKLGAVWRYKSANDLRYTPKAACYDKGENYELFDL